MYVLRRYLRPIGKSLAAASGFGSLGQNWKPRAGYVPEPLVAAGLDVHKEPGGHFKPYLKVQGTCNLQAL